MLQNIEITLQIKNPIEKIEYNNVYTILFRLIALYSRKMLPSTWISHDGIHQEQRLKGITNPEEIAKNRERWTNVVFEALYRRKKKYFPFELKIE